MLAVSHNPQFSGFRRLARINKKQQLDHTKSVYLYSGRYGRASWEPKGSQPKTWSRPGFKNKTEMGIIDDFGSRYESGVFTNNGYELLLSFLNSPNDDKDKIIPIVYFGSDHLEFMEDIATHLAILINDFGLPRIDDFFHSMEGYHQVKEVTIHPIKDHKRIWVTLYSEG